MLASIEPFVSEMEARAKRSAVVPLRPEHVEYLMPRVAIFDEDTVREHWGSGATEMLQLAVRSSVLAWAGLVDGLPICAFGLHASITSDTAIAWLIPTPEVRRHRRLFWRASREVVAMMLDRFPHLVVHCQANYDASRKWLERLGFVEIPNASFHVAHQRTTPKAFVPGIGFSTLHLTRT